MDGINRYFQPNTLDGLSIYDTILPGEPLYVDGSNAMQADADMGNHNVKNVATATANDEAVNLGQVNTALAGKADLTYVNTQLATKADTLYVNTQDNLRVLKSGDTMTGALAMSGNKITGLAAGTTNGDAVRYEQLTGLTANLVTTNTTQTITASKTFTAPLTTGDIQRTVFHSGEIMTFTEPIVTPVNLVFPPGVAGWQTIFTFPYTPRVSGQSVHALFYVDTPYFMTGDGTDTFYVRIQAVSPTLTTILRIRHQFFFNGGGGGTRSSSLFPFTASFYAPIQGTTYTIQVQVNNGTNDTIRFQDANNTQDIVATITEYL